MSRRLLALLAAAVAALCVLPAAASAHAVLQETQPSRGAALDSSPSRVTMGFSEAVESSFGGLRVFDADGARVDRGEVLRPSSSEVAIRLRDDLPDGAYTATYRLVSADSHPISGGFVFTVGDAGGQSAAAVADLVDSGGAGPATDTAFGIARTVGYAATALLAGGLLFILLVWLPALRGLQLGEARETAPAGAFARRTRTLLVAAAVAGLLSAALGIVVQGALAGGTSVWDAFSPGVIDDVLDTRFGTVWEFRVTAFGLLVPLLLYMLVEPTGNPSTSVLRRPCGRARTALTAIAVAAPAAYLVISPALSGHAGADDDSLLLVPLDVLHVAAMSAWVGGLALLLLAVPAATRALDGPDRTRLLAALVTRFSTVALIAVATLLATGIVQSILYLDAVSDLVDTAFGRAILVKAAILLALIALGAHNRQRSRPRLAKLAAGNEPPGSAGRTLRRALIAEVALMVGVLGVTAALVSYSPSSATPAGPFSAADDLGPARLETTVDPARTGRNEVHFYLFDRGTGAQYDRGRKLNVTAEQPHRDIGPLELDARKAGPGHYTIPNANFVPGGEWVLTPRLRISEFDEYRTEIDVPIE